MKPKCYLARLVIAGACPGETAPGWVSRHIERCDACRAEAESLQATRSLVQEQACEPDCPVEWADVRAALREPVPMRRPAWRLAGAAACAAFLVAAAVWMLTAPAPKQHSALRQPGVAPVTRPAPEQPKVVKRTEPAPWIAEIKETKPVKKPSQPGSVKRRTPKYRKTVPPPHRLMVKHEKPSEPAKKAPEAPRIVAVAPEEHVIGIVGVSVGEDDEHSYVIREVSAVANGEARVVRL